MNPPLMSPNSLASAILTILFLSSPGITHAASPATLPRLMVLTDIGGDPDDQQSLIRLLLHSNQLQIEGFIASASGTPGELGIATTRVDLIHATLAAYEHVQPNLSLHDARYPTADSLRPKVHPGNPQRGQHAIGPEHDTPGSHWIIQRLNHANPRPLNISIWGGQTDLAQALWRIRQDSSKDHLASILQRTRVFDIADQDGLAPWIQKEFPELYYILSAAPEGADRREAAFRGMYLEGNLDCTSREWLAEHVLQNHGPLGALYPTRTWTAPNPHGALKEGDTPSWFFFLENGLNLPDHPEAGGWGGRYIQTSPNSFQDAADTLDNKTHTRLTVARWRPAFQSDLQARLDWCVQPPSHANHHPVAQLNNTPPPAPLILHATPNSTVHLDASTSSDPDQDELSYEYFSYPEASTPPTPLTISNPNQPITPCLIPPNTPAGTYHVILAVTDDGTPPLTAYRRILIQVH